nr:hypothetical protein [Tanacetum cinerariifolium]
MEHRSVGKVSQEFQGLQYFIGLSEMTHDKLVTEADTFHGSASLDPGEEKILYGSDENIWDAFSSDINIYEVAEASSRVAGLHEELTGVNFPNLNKQTPLADVNFSNTSAMGFGVDGDKMKDDHQRYMGFVHDDDKRVNFSFYFPLDPGISIFEIAEALPDDMTPRDCKTRLNLNVGPSTDHFGWDVTRVTILAFLGSLEMSYARKQDIKDVGLIADLNVARIINGPTVVFISHLAGTRHVATRN